MKRVSEEMLPDLCQPVALAGMSESAPTLTAIADTETGIIIGMVIAIVLL